MTSVLSAACTGNWNNWTDCDAVCNENGISDIATGRQKRVYTTTGGERMEVDIPCTKTCPLRCIGDYSIWSDCDAYCDNNNSNSISSGYKTRTYSIIRNSQNGGANCNVLNGTIQPAKCDKICPVNCIGEWSNWSSCEATVACSGKDPDTKGKRRRTYKIITPASIGGNDCKIANGQMEIGECSKECPVDSMFFYMTILFVSFFGLLILLTIGYFIRKYYNKKHTDKTGKTSSKRSMSTSVIS